ncbi:hypothetical protein FB45DRAFT_949429, partial [Roridomyces roridus]
MASDHATSSSSRSAVSSWTLLFSWVTCTWSVSTSRESSSRRLSFLPFPLGFHIGILFIRAAQQV